MSTAAPPSITTSLSNNVTTVNASTTPFWMRETKEEAMRDFFIGLTLAVVSATLTGSSFILKKKGLLNVSKKSTGLRAGDGGFLYLKEWMWWSGMITMIIGEILNFMAYLFAPATLVTPLGALSVIASAMMASYFLNEKLNLLGKIGCLLCVLGSTLMVVNAPKEAEIQTMEELLSRILEPPIIIVCILLISVAIVGIVFVAPRYGQKNLLVYVTICSSLGSFTVMGCKGVGVAIKETTRGRNEFTNPLTYIMIFIVISFCILEMVYLNKALDIFNTAIVTPTYYVIFTSFVILFSLVLFKEFGKMSWEDIVGAFVGFLVIVIGIFLLNAFKNMSVSLRHLPKAHKRSTSHSSQNGDITHAVHDDHHLLEDNENHSQEEDNSLDTAIVFTDKDKVEYRDAPKEVFTPDRNSNIPIDMEILVE